MAVSLALGGAILYWMYRGVDFGKVRHVLLYEMDWGWMLLSFPFGVLAQALRGWRWGQTLEPIGIDTRKSTRVHSVFLSYAVSLVVPRAGEFARCAVLKRYDGASFSKSLGTVVTERAIDSVLVVAVAFFSFALQLPVFSSFFSKTGVSVSSVFGRFSPQGYFVAAVCAVAAIVLLHFMFRQLSLYKRVKDALEDLWQGVLSVRKVKKPCLFLANTIAIWACYFLHYYIAFFCFGFTSGLGLGCAMASFVVGSIAVIVPTPNGAGPWHFAVKTMLVLYGVAEFDALNFVLIVHSVQTMLVALLGVYAYSALALTKKTQPYDNLNKLRQ